MAVTRDVSTVDLTKFCSHLFVYLQKSLLDPSLKDPSVRYGKITNTLLGSENTAGTMVRDPFAGISNSGKKSLQILYRDLPCIEDESTDCSTIDPCTVGATDVAPLKADTVDIDECAGGEFSFSASEINALCDMMDGSPKSLEAFKQWKLDRIARSIVSKMNKDTINALIANAGNYLDGENSAAETKNLPILDADLNPNTAVFGAVNRYLDKTGFDSQDYFWFVGEKGAHVIDRVMSRVGGNQSGFDGTYGIPNLIYDAQLDQVAGGESKIVLVPKYVFQILEWFKYATPSANQFAGRQYIDNAVDLTEFKAQVLDIAGTNTRFDYTLKRDVCPDVRYKSTLVKNYDFYTLPNNCKDMNGILVFNSTCADFACTDLDTLFDPVTP